MRPGAETVLLTALEHIQRIARDASQAPEDASTIRGAIEEIATKALKAVRS